MNEDKSRAPIKGNSINVAQEVESDRIWNRLKDLNQEMLRLPMAERRKRWREYYVRLKGLRSDSDKLGG